MYRKKLDFQEKLRITVARLINAKPPVVNFATIVENAAAYNRAEIYDIYRTIQQLGFINPDGTLNVEEAQAWLDKAKR
jgi:hypothetical protein